MAAMLPGMLQVVPEQSGNVNTMKPEQSPPSAWAPRPDQPPPAWANRRQLKHAASGSSNGAASGNPKFADSAPGLPGGSLLNVPAMLTPIRSPRRSVEQSSIAAGIAASGARSGSPFKQLLALLESEHEHIVAVLHEEIDALRRRNQSHEQGPWKQQFSSSSNQIQKVAESLQESYDRSDSMDSTGERFPEPPSSAHSTVPGSTMCTIPNSAVSSARPSILTTLPAAPSLPKNIALLDVWAEKFEEWKSANIPKGEQMLKPAHTVNNMACRERRSTEQRDSVLWLVSFKDEGSASRCIQWPNSPQRICWDIVGMTLIMWDLISVPLQTFSLPENVFSRTMGWIARLFWTMDIVASFSVGYIRNGETVMHPKKIAINYMKTWFALDMTLIVSDWMFLVFRASSRAEDSGGVGRIFRVLRGMRVARLLRLLKVRQMLTALQEIINSRYTFIMMGISKLIMFLLAMNHIVACVWYGIGTHYKESGDTNWIDVAVRPSDDFLYRYSTSLHWSLTQFTPASMSVQPTNGPERTYANIILILGLVLFSSFTANLTHSMSQMRNMNRDIVEQFWVLRRFLYERSVPRALSARIQRFLEHQATVSKSYIQEHQVKILSLLSRQLMDELHYVMHVQDLIQHPMLDMIRVISDATLYRLASALACAVVAQDDSVFFEGEPGIHMHFVVQGELVYVRKRHDQTLMSGDWLCEPVLWVHWTHLGDLHAITNADLLSFTAFGFSEAVLTHPPVALIVARYAEEFVQHLQSLETEELNDMVEWTSEVLKEFPRDIPFKTLVPASMVSRTKKAPF